MATYWCIDYVNGSNATGASASSVATAAATPFKTWAGITQTAGHTYLFNCNTTYIGAVTVTTGGTSEATRVTIGSYDSTTGAQTTGGTKRAPFNGDGTNITIRVGGNTHFVTIDNLEVYGTDGTGGSRAIGIYLGSDATTNANDCIVKYCHVHDIDYSLYPAQDNNAIQLFGSRNIIENNLIENIPTDGVWYQGNDNIVRYNRIIGVSTNGTNGDCIQGHGDATLSNNNAKVYGNYLDHLNKNSKQCIIIGGINYSNNAHVYQNYCLMALYDSVTSTAVIHCEASNSRIESNYCYGGYHGILTHSSGTDNSVRGNICVSNVRGISSTATGMLVYFNTISSATGHGVYIDTDTTCAVKNNILLNCAVGVAMETGSTEDYNLYYGCTTNQATLGGVAAWGANIFTSNPLLDANYRPTDSSPCLNAGTFVSGVKDYNGKRIKNPPDIGAIQNFGSRTISSRRGI